MSTVISLLCVLACAVPLDGQIAATLSRSAGGLEEVRIQNNSEKSLAAFVVAVKQVPLSPNSGNAPFVVYSDPLIDSTAEPLLPNDQRVVMVSGFRDPSGRMRPLLDEPIVAAAIYTDGSTTGDATLLTRLIFRRTNMLLAVETALEILSDAGNRNIPRDQLTKQFSKMAEFMNRWYLSPEQRVGRSLYQAIAGKLMNLPEGEAGSPFPPSSFVANETAALNRQRVMLLESQPRLADVALIERSVVF